MAGISRPPGMTRNDYQAAVRKMQRITLITSLGVVGPGVWFILRLIGDFDVQLRSYGASLTLRYGDSIGGALAGLSVAPVVVLPLLLCVSVILAFDRRVGRRCPHCHRSLTARCLPQRVLDSGECSLCHMRVFEESDDA